MALQDLTPQLRTRLNRMERAVGWFLFLATALLLFGFGYYLYQTAANKGWFLNKAKYFIFADTAQGLVIGDPIQFRGKTAGHITDIQPMPARGEGSEYNIYVEFNVQDPNIGYVWTEGSKVRVNAADFLGKRVLEITRGTNGYSTYINSPVQEMTLDQARSSPHADKLRLAQDIRDGTNVITHAWRPLSDVSLPGSSNIWVVDPNVKRKALASIWNAKQHHYEPLTKKTKPYGLDTDENPALTDRLQALVSEIETALPGILAITNRINTLLDNTSQTTSNLNVLAESARPMITNLAVITTNLRNPNGSLGDWLIPTNLNLRLDTTLRDADTNLVVLAESLQKSLENLAGITSNLNHQVQVNTNILSNISDIVVHSDQFVQGLKRHWFLRSAFKTNAPPSAPALNPGQQLQSPKTKNMAP